MAVKRQPKRGPSRDRTLPGKQRIQMRRYLKYLDKLDEVVGFDLSGSDQSP